MSRTVAVVDYGMGNLRSVAKALEHVAPDANVQVTSDAAVIAAAERVVMPGQGAMPDCMREFTARGLREAIVKAAAEKPFLGICVGEQMLFGHAEEGNVMGLEIMPGRIPRFPAGLTDANSIPLKVPHMGWPKCSRIPCGRGSLMVRVSILCTATLCSRKMTPSLPAVRSMASPLPAL